MGKQRKNHAQDLKETVVLAALRDEASVAELSRTYGISQALIHKWKAQFIEGGRQALAPKARGAQADKQQQDETERLKRLLAEKVLELDIAKKVRGL